MKWVYAVMIAAGFAMCVPPAPGITADAPPVQSAPSGPLEATLANGMHVVILTNRLAPVVSTSLYYNVGSIDDMIPGIAHATEHMMFRGTDALSSDQFATLATRIGAQYDAETSGMITRYYFTVPASYLDVVLRVEADRMQHASMREADWKNERGAIEQEVQAHLSNPVLKALTPVNHIFYGESPWGRDPVGTIAGFEKMKAADIAAFYHTWYRPNNATLVIAGDVDPNAALASVKTWFDGIASAPLPAHPALPVAPIAATTLNEKIDFPIPLALVAMRLPGLDDPDWPAIQVLFSVLNSQRGALADLALQGKALLAIASANAFPAGGSASFAAISLPGSNPATTIADLHGVISAYAKNGIPDDLILTTKSALLASSAYEGASIPGQAREWTDAESTGRSPAQFYSALTSVTPADVNRVFIKYIANGVAVDAALAASPQAAITPVSLAGGKENVQVSAVQSVTLPAWANDLAGQLRAPRIDDRATVLHLKNGMTVAVRPEASSPTFVLAGTMQSNPDVYEPKGKEGVSQLTASLLAYGTTTYDRNAFIAQLESIAAVITPGPVLFARANAEQFDRTVQLLADAELHPTFPADKFALIQSDAIKAARAVEGRPEAKAAVAQLNAMYPSGDPHRRHATSASLAAVTLDDVKRWYAFAYRPDLTTVAVVGDVAPDQVKATFEKYFSAWQNHGARPSMEYPPVKDARAAKHAPKSVTIASTTSKQADVTLTQSIGVRRYDRDAVALDIANTMLSGEGTGSMLFRDVRKRHGYVYSIDSALDIRDTSATFALTFAADPGNVDRAQVLAANTIQRLRRAAPSAADVALAKAMLLSTYTVALDSYDGVASDLLVGALSGIDANERARYYAQVIATTPEEIQRAMNRWIDPARFTRVIVAPSSP
jgi:zinc protease